MVVLVLTDLITGGIVQPQNLPESDKLIGACISDLAFGSLYFSRSGFKTSRHTWRRANARTMVKTKDEGDIVHNAAGLDRPT